mmetsp:Transcript_4571/g.6458  ORF Transcript_4571/g.6458 Transcript_4571/m.6458 type:complete len:266 (-) Transcript_4571:66-863(-)
MHHSSPRGLKAVTPYRARMQADDSGASYGNYGGMFEARPPSEKQLAYAQRLAQQVGSTIPEDALKDSMQISQFIDDCLTKAKPTERQVAYAQTIARDAGIELPEAATRSSKACSEFIEANQHLLPGRRNMGTGVPVPGSAGGGGMAMGGSMRNPPTQNQIMLAVSLAQQLNIGLAAEVLTDSAVMSRFIDECQNGRRFVATAAPPEVRGTNSGSTGFSTDAAATPGSEQTGAAETPPSQTVESMVSTLPEYEKPDHNGEEEPLPF